MVQAVVRVSGAANTAVRVDGYTDDTVMQFGTSNDSGILYDGSNDEWTVQTRNASGTLTDRIRVDGNTDTPTMYVDGGSGDVTTPVITVFSNQDDRPQLKLVDEDDDSATKQAIIVGGHYTNAQKDMAVVVATSSSSENAVEIGGGRNDFTAATRFRVYLAANQTTDGNAAGNAQCTWAPGDLRFNQANKVRTSTGILTLDGDDGIYLKCTAGGTTAVDVQNYLKLSGLGSAGSGTDLVIDGSDLVIPKSSSVVHKDNVRDMGIDSSGIFDLTPREFEWKRDGITDFGLIAEEVHEILPEMVIYDREGAPKAVKYDQLSILLLKELSKIKREMEDNNADLE